jgi:branched-chain amino acid aminotransferase
MQALANVNGKITPLKDAQISVLDRGFLFGDSIYEVVRTYQGRPFFLEEHTDRLENSARLAKMKMSQSRSFLHDEIKRTVAAAEAKEDVFIRYTITRGVGVIDLDPNTIKETGFVIFVKEIPPWNPQFYSRGMRLAVPRTRRNSPLSLDPNIKSGNYMNNIIAVAEAKELGADDALILSIDDKLTECSNSNILFVLDGKVVSPLHDPKSSTGNLRGLTKRIVNEICQEFNIPYGELPLKEADLSKASECFVTSATREVMPVREIKWSNGKIQSFPEGGGEITRKLKSSYADYVIKNLKLSKIEPWYTW